MSLGETVQHITVCVWLACRMYERVEWGTEEIETVIEMGTERWT